MPFGLENAPCTFQRTMLDILRPYSSKRLQSKLSTFRPPEHWPPAKTLNLDLKYNTIHAYQVVSRRQRVIQGVAMWLSIPEIDQGNSSCSPATISDTDGLRLVSFPEHLTVEFRIKMEEHSRIGQ